MVIAYEMVKRGFDRGRAEGRAEGRVEGRVEGRTEALSEANRQNAEYYKRMQDAHARGEEFNEPPPRFENYAEEQD